MDGKAQTALRAFPLVTYTVALVFLVVAIIGSIQLMSSSVIGGIAVLLAALISLGLTGWRISVKFGQLRTGS